MKPRLKEIKAWCHFNRHWLHREVTPEELRRIARTALEYHVDAMISHDSKPSYHHTQRIYDIIVLQRQKTSAEPAEGFWFELFPRTAGSEQPEEISNQGGPFPDRQAAWNDAIAHQKRALYHTRIIMPRSLEIPIMEDNK